MKQDTKDFIKRTAGTSALVASPGILAGTLIAGPLGGLAVGGAVAAGNVLGSLAYKKAKEVREDVENRRKFRELQRSVLAQNGILYYQPMVPTSMVGATGDMSCLGKILHKDFGFEVITRPIGEKIASTPFGRGVTFVSALGDGIVNRKGKPTIADSANAIFHTGNYSCGNFSEENLLSVDEEELKHIKDVIEFTSDSSEKELKKSRYLSMLNEVSRDRLEELLDEGKPKEELGCCEVCETPVSMFSESPNLQTIAKGVDFGILSVLSSGVGSLFGKAKIAGNIAKNTKALTKATSNATKAAEAASKASETGGWLGKIATGIGKTAGKVKAGFTGNTVEKAAENVAEGATKAAEAGAKVAEEASEGAEKLIDAGKKAADETTKVTTKLSEIQKRVDEGGVMNKYELKGVQMAGNSQLAASLGEKIGYENLGRGMKAIKTAGATQTAEQIQKNQAKQQQTA